MPDFDLYDLEIEEVSSVDDGDNRGAHVVLFKRRGGSGDETGAPAEGPPVGSDEWIRKVVAEESDAERGGADRGVLVKRLAEMFGWTEEEIEKAEGAWQPPTFDDIQRDKMRYAIEDELFGYVASLQDAMMMALAPDAETGQKMRESLDQFYAATGDAIGRWEQGKTAMSKEGRKIATARLKTLKEAQAAIARIIEEAEPGDAPAPAKKTKKEGGSEVKFTKANVAEFMGLESEDQVTDEQLAKFNEHAGEEAPAQDSPAPAADAPGDEFEKALAGLPEAARNVLRKERADRLASDERVAKMVEKEQNAEYIRKARTDGYTNAEEIGPVMRRLAMGMPEAGDVEKLSAAHRAMSEQVNAGALFGQTGNTTVVNKGGGGTAMQEATAAATELMKSNPGKYGSIATARREVYNANPELAERVSNEQRGA